MAESPESDGLTLITCTGGRPEAFALCKRWLYRQDWRGGLLQWLVVDDGREPMGEFETPDWVSLHYLRREPQPGEGHTLRQNLLTAIPRIVCEKVVFWEDDDWYSVRYLTNMSLALDHFAIFGEGRAKYYNVATRRWRVCGNEKHASMCQTGMRTEHIDRLHWQIKSRPSHFVDARLWADPILSKKKKLIFNEGMAVGIKGMPGRHGIGIGHRLKANAKVDLTGDKLREWLGDDADAYLGFFFGEGRAA